MTKRKCPNCERSISGHPNKKFCGSRCKDKFHNKHNPRGLGLRAIKNPRVIEEYEGGTSLFYANWSESEGGDVN
ncbi:MAG: hypothetical protein JKY81_01690 [Colwellia sp.]|nr:hypothetical protein [Colwellia sp.]